MSENCGLTDVYNRKVLLYVFKALHGVSKKALITAIIFQVTDRTTIIFYQDAVYHHIVNMHIRHRADKFE